MNISLDTWGRLSSVRRNPTLVSIRTEISRRVRKIFKNEKYSSSDRGMQKMNQEIQDRSFKHANIPYDFDYHKNRTRFGMVS